ncbi:3706_t:CDS:2, partial [Cetraspora pellucida]
KCKTIFAPDTATSTLRRHLNLHGIIASTRGQIIKTGPNNEFHNEFEQQERDKGVLRWIICDLELFNTVESEE